MRKTPEKAWRGGGRTGTPRESYIPAKKVCVSFYVRIDKERKRLMYKDISENNLTKDLEQLEKGYKLMRDLEDLEYDFKQGRLIEIKGDPVSVEIGMES